ncbi:MAG TPA: N-acetylmuramoyl-L-alanine amidase, partial [Chloroflexia bacterium]|nr:N-acetylmuramoyl-L-alanine amidase [Chloroflexia bacterium]
GGLAQFGFPISEEYKETLEDGRSYTVQYFERARFEYHPENLPPYNVLLGLLGRTVTAGREHEPPFVPAQPSGAPGTLYFKETGHNMAREFVSYWREHGGLPVYGYPISEPFPELSRTDGKTYLVQYFERNRLEWHPELPDPYKVSLGLLGVQVVYGRK